MANINETEWEAELEGELEAGLGSEYEQHEAAGEFEAEFEQHEGAQESEWELESQEFESAMHELEGEFETGEQFFGKIARGIGKFVKRAAPFLKKIAKVAAPMVGTAIGGPFGAILGRAASSALGESELENEYESEFELEGTNEFEMEFETGEYEQHEAAHEIAQHEVTQHEALAELMAEAAAQEQHEGEAEAMAGASVMTALSPADRRALRRILPHLVRGTAILTRVLRRQKITRPAVRAVPTIMRRTVRDLKRQAAAGTPITRKAAGRAAATQIKKVLGNPSACAAAIKQNVRASRKLKAQPVAG
jgi:hypothetical protein